MKNNAPLPEPKPWIRKSADILEQAQNMMTPPEDIQHTPLDDDPE